MSLYRTLPAALQATFPDYPWDPARFVRKSPGHWSETSNIKRAMGIAEERLGIKEV